MNEKILYVFRGEFIKRIFSLPEVERPNDFLYGFNHLKKYFNCQYVIAPRSKRKTLIQKFFFVIQKPFSIFTKLGFPLEIYPLFKDKLKKADIIFCPNETIGFGILFWKMLGRIKAKVIVLVMSLPERLKYFKNNKLLIYFITRLLSQADIIFTLSDIAQKPLINIFNVSPKKIKTFYFGVDLNFWQSNKNACQNNLIISVGNDMNRDFDTLVEAIPSNFKLIIITIKKVNTQGKTNFKIVSGISDLKLRNLYRSAVVTIIPSIKLNYESSGLSSTLQAMACGSPVIISDAPTIRELFQENHHCLFYKPTNSDDLKSKLLKLTKDRKLRKRLSTNSLKLLRQNHSTKNMAQQIQASIEKIG